MVIFVSSQYVTKLVPLAFQNFFTDFPSITPAEQFPITYNIWPENFINPSQALGLKGVECLLVSFSHFPCFASIHACTSELKSLTLVVVEYTDDRYYF